MKRLLGLLAIFFALQASAQSNTNATPAKASATRVAPSLDIQGPTSRTSTITLKPPPRPNEIVKGNVTYSGISVAIVKNGHPLQLLNPMAPPEYGEPEDNVVRDINSKKVTGLKFFAIRF